MTPVAFRCEDLVICPACGSSDSRRSRRRNAFERILGSTAQLYPWRCPHCNARFFRLGGGERVRLDGVIAAERLRSADGLSYARFGPGEVGARWILPLVGVATLSAIAIVAAMFVSFSSTKIPVPSDRAGKAAVKSVPAVPGAPHVDAVGLLLDSDVPDPETRKDTKNREMEGH